MIDEDGYPDDPGLAIERTLMAWGRTALVFVGLGGLLVRFGEREHVEALAYSVAVLSLVCGAVPYGLSRRAYAEQRLPLMGPAELRWVAIATAVISVLAGLTVVLGLT